MKAMTGSAPAKSRRQKRRGAAAIEFAFVALPFFILMLAIFEIGMMLLVSALVETATSDASRLIRTGQAQIQNLTPEQIKTRFCSKMSVFNKNCDARTHIDIRVVKAFSGNIAPDPMQTGIFDPEVLAYQPGVPGDFVLVRIWFEHPIFTPFISDALTRSDDNVVRLNSTLAFRNEPYL
jgi:hypothetical protein